MVCFDDLSLNLNPLRENLSVAGHVSIVLAHPVHFVDHSAHNADLSLQVLIADDVHFPLRASKELYENVVYFHPVTLVGEVAGAFDNLDHGVLAEF